MLPEVTRQLNGHALYGASFFAYLLASLIALVWAGYTTDNEGPRKPFIIGVSIFIIGLWVGATAQSMEQFVFGRALQGFGGGSIQSVVFAAVNLVYKEEQRKRAIALLATGWVLPALLAPMIAGYITERWNWSWVFWMLIPFALIVCMITQDRLRELSEKVINNSQNSATTTHDLTSSRSLLITAFRISGGIGLFLTGINLYSDSLLILPYSIIGCVLFVRPLIHIFPTGIWKASPGLGAALALKLLLIFACLGTEAFIPILLTNTYSYTPFEAGSVVTSGAMAWIIATWLYDVIGDRIPSKILLIIGSGTLTSGIFLLLFILTIWQAPAYCYFAWALTCFGMGLAYTITITEAMNHTDEGSEGNTATGAGMVDAIGFSFAAGIGGAILNTTKDYNWQMLESVQLIWAITGAIALIAFFISCTRFPRN